MVFHSSSLQENVERAVKEAAQRKVQELEEQKRHSWGGEGPAGRRWAQACSPGHAKTPHWRRVGGAFSPRCSSEADLSAALLVELLTSRPRPLGRARATAPAPSPVVQRQLDTPLPDGEEGPDRSCDLSPTNPAADQPDRDLGAVGGSSDQQTDGGGGPEGRDTLQQSPGTPSMSGALS